MHYISSRAPPPPLPAPSCLKWATLSSGCQAEHNGEQEAFGSGENEKSRTLLLHSEALTRSFCLQTQIRSANLLCSSQRFLPELSPPLVVTGKGPVILISCPTCQWAGLFHHLVYRARTDSDERVNSDNFICCKLFFYLTLCHLWKFHENLFWSHSSNCPSFCNFWNLVILSSFSQSATCWQVPAVPK